MVIPQTTELFIDGEWVDVTSYVRGSQGVILTRGRKDEKNRVTPTTCSLTLDNRDGRFSNRYPLSPYFGKLGKNLQLRHTIRTGDTLSDDFNRSVSNAWTGGSFTWTNSGGTVPDDYDINGAKGLHTHAATNTNHFSYANTGSADHRVRTVINLSVGTLTGAGATTRVHARFTDTSNWYSAALTYATSGLVTMQFSKTVAGVGAAFGDVVTIGTFANLAGTQIALEIYVKGSKLYANAWDISTSVAGPAGWMLTATDTDLSTGTNAGVSSRRTTGNTDANLQAAFDSFLAVPGWIRCVVEVPAFQQRWDITGTDIYTPIQGAGIKRRLGQGQRPLRSALWRENLLNGPIAFWPLNDGIDSVTAGSALSGKPSMSILKDGELELRQINSWVEPILTPDTGEFLTYNGVVDQPVSDTEWSGDFVFAVDTDAEDADLTMSWEGPATALAGLSEVEWILTVEAIGTDDFITWGLIVRSFDGSAATNTSIGSGTVPVKDGSLHHVRLTTDNNGANTDWELLIDNSSIDSGTTSEPWLPVETARLDYGTETDGQMTAGFVTVWDTASPPFNAANAAVVGRSGELAAARLARLCIEEGIAYEIIGDADTTEAMGPQRIDTLLHNLEDVEDVDMGVLYEPRHFFGFSYRTRESLYLPNQSAVTISYPSHHLSKELADDDDDSFIRNDIEASRPNGSSVRIVQETGPLNVQDPTDDPNGVGIYDESRSINVDTDDQLSGLVSWLRNLGTYDDQARFPVISVALHRAPFIASATLTASLANLDIGDYLIVEDPPSPPHAPDDLGFITEGGTERVDNFTWEMDFNTTPAGRYNVGVFENGTDATRKRYSSRNSTTSGSITTGTSTSLSVAIGNDGSLWATGSSSPTFPFEINLLGARVQVTQISGASSPQTFTISTTVVNGVAKAIPSGTPVRLWDEVRYGR